MAIYLMSFVCLIAVFSMSNGNPFPYKTAYFDQTVDHFDQMKYGGKTFKQKYLYQDKNWKGCEGPIFFYAGNEGPVEGFWEASGFINEFAVETKALVVFAEHRYYGSSLPFGKDSFKSPYLGLLTVEQAMADYAVFLTDFKKQFNASDCKVIAFGGSYGGMLAAYMRFKYPNIIDGSLAASAPIYMQDPVGPRDFFFKLVTKDFRDHSLLCHDLTVRIFDVIHQLASHGGLDAVSRYFRLCQPLKDQAAYRHLLGWIRNAFTVMSMLDYPYATGFMGNLPAFPVKAACDAIVHSHNPITGLADAAGIFYNTSTTQTCFDIYAEFTDCADPTGCGLGNDGIAWDYQACTSINLPAGSNGITDMFPVLPWTPSMRKEYCQKTYGVTPQEEWPAIQFWGEKVKTASNIIFSNGDLDPWRGGGVNEDISDTVVSILVEGGAHHLDLRASNPADPAGVKKARAQEKAIIKKWIAQA